MDVGDGRGGIDCSMSAVVVSRCGEGVREAAIRKTEGVGAGDRVLKEPKGERGVAVAAAVASAVAGGPLSVVESRSAAAGTGSVNMAARS